MPTIRHVAVIGAGVMGSGIAAHAANGGAEVTLLDIDASLAAGGVEEQRRAGGFMAPEFAARVCTGSVADNIDRLRDADWIIEAVAERLDIKRDLYERIAAVKKPGAIVSSNTSTIPLRDLTDGLPETFAARFMITHFFNPPRVMRLFEMVTGPQTDAAAVARIRDFADRALGKGVVDCKDTPGFIANRIGNYWLLLAAQEAIAAGLDVEEADALIGAPFDIPRTGVFGLLDLVGIDLMSAILTSFRAALPDTDAMQAIADEPQVVRQMLREGHLGRKSGTGFYRISRDRTSREVVDLATGAYRPQRVPGSAALEVAKSGPRALMESDTPGGRYASRVMRRTLAYAVSLLPEIADNPHEVDQAMALGYGWKRGPFSLIDSLDTEWFAEHLREHGEPVPPYLTTAAEAGRFFLEEGGKTRCLLPDGSWTVIEPAPGVVSLPAVKAQASAVLSSDGASLWDMGDGVALLELHGKMNALDLGVMGEIGAGLEKAEAEFGALVIATGGRNFSAGADLSQFLRFVDADDMSAIAAQIEAGQQVMRAIKFARIPVVAAASGVALGGGCELIMHSAAAMVHAELSIGLVETSVGLIPAWGGCKEMLLRFSDTGAAGAKGPVAPALAAFDLISAAKRSSSAAEGRNLGCLGQLDRIVMNVERVLVDAKTRAMELMEAYEPPEPRKLRLAGPSGALALRTAIETQADTGRLSAHDQRIAVALADVLTGGASADPSVPVGEDEIFALERAAFLELIGQSATRERIQHMLATGKPLRN